MNVTNAFLSGIKDCKEFAEASDIAKRNSSGKIWLIGGFVYRNIASQLYNLPKPEVDLDFIIEKPVKQFDLPNGWNIEKNRFGNPKFVNDKMQIDYVPLGNIYSIQYRDLEPSIENFLTGTGLKIQSIAYSFHENKIIGSAGIDALKKKVIEVNNMHFAEYAAQKKGKSLKQYMQEKADSLHFTPVFPVA